MHKIDGFPRDDGLERKEKSLELFLAMTQALKDQLILKDVSAVERLLDQRQALMDTIDRMDGEIHEIRPRDPLSQVRREMRESFTHIEDTLQKAKLLDKQCMEMTLTWREDLKNTLSKMRDSLKAVHGYGPKSTNPPRFMDITR
jgi:hypothetical protein